MFYDRVYYFDPLALTPIQQAPPKQTPATREERAALAFFLIISAIWIVFLAAKALNFVAGIWASWGGQ